MYIYNLGLLFSKVAFENASRAAIRQADGVLHKYLELEELSNQIAHFMIRKGMTINNVAVIFNNKTLLSYSIMLACLKAGVIYVNIDPLSPIERLKKMVDQCDPSIFFYYSGSIDVNNLPIFNNANLAEYTSDSFIKSLKIEPKYTPIQTKDVTGVTPAYIMFTSGSTGFPKGVVISHSNVLNFINWSVSVFGTTVDDIFTNVNPMHFDNSVFDFYSSIFTGASIIPVIDKLTRNPRKMLDFLNKLDPTIWFSVPSMLVYMMKLRALKQNDLLSLRIVSFGGEGFPKNQIRNLWEFWGHRVKFINVYGPTECTCICSSYEISRDDLINEELLPLGPIAPNFYKLIIDETGLPVVNEIMGEMCIGGPNVGLGYYNDPSKTSEVFIQNPLIVSHKEIIYKSGDIVRFDKNKNILHFIGRKDNQIKRMGYRIELEEIEHALNSLDYVKENSVIVPESDRIVACVCSEIKDSEMFINDLQKLLPHYMIPDTFRFFDELPKNQNGKIDRMKLKGEVKS